MDWGISVVNDARCGSYRMSRCFLFRIYFTLKTHSCELFMPAGGYSLASDVLRGLIETNRKFRVQTVVKFSLGCKLKFSFN